MDLIYLLLLTVNAIFVSNVIFSQFLGICPYLGVSKKLDTAVGMGMAVIFVLTLANFFTYLAEFFILDRFGLEFLRTIAFILIIASLVQFVEIFMKKHMNTLYQSLGIYLPLITTNCAVLGLALLAIQKHYNLVTSLVFAMASGVGFLLAIVLFAGIRERLEYAFDIPKVFKGTPIALITAAILAMAFMGFTGIVKI